MPTSRRAWGTPPWSIDCEVPRRALPAHVEVAVVGAGFAGLATAWRLAQRGVRVAVLEAGRVGAGASGRTGGLALEETAAGPLEGVDACLPALERAVRDAGIDCDLRIERCTELLHATEPPRGGIAWRDGESWLRASDRVPGGTLDPGALVAGLARAALDVGVTIHEHAAVDALRLGATAPIDVGGRALRCDRVVLATGALLGTLMPHVAGFRPALTLALATAPLPESVHAALGLADGRPFYTADLPYLWGRALRDGELVFGAGLVTAPEVPLQVVDVRDGAAAERLAALEARVRGLHPVLADVAVARRWGGPVSSRTGGVPILARHPDDPRMILTSAYAGHGVALSARVAELASEAVAAGAELPAWGGLDR